MKANYFERLMEYENNMDGLIMPYLNFGSTDLQIMQEKYKNLTNKPTHYLETRYLEYQW
jgi:hypothetical protein